MLSVLRVGDVAVLLVALLVVGLVELVWLLRAIGDGHPGVRPPALAAAALTGLALGVELGFGFGGGPGLVLVAATAYLGARIAWLAALIGWSSSAHARRPLIAWRRCQVAGLATSALLWLVLVTGSEVTDRAVSAVTFHGIRFDLPGGSALLLVLISVSIVGEGVLQYQAHRATEEWAAADVRKRQPSPVRRSAVDDLARELDALDDDDDGAGVAAVHGPDLVLRPDES